MASSSWFASTRAGASSGALAIAMRIDGPSVRRSMSSIPWTRAARSTGRGSRCCLRPKASSRCVRAAPRPAARSAPSSSEVARPFAWRSASSRLPMTAVIRLLKSWAIPPVSCPSTSSFCAWRSTASVDSVFGDLGAQARLGLVELARSHRQLEAEPQRLRDRAMEIDADQRKRGEEDEDHAGHREIGHRALEQKARRDRQAGRQQEGKQRREMRRAHPERADAHAADHEDEEHLLEDRDGQQHGAGTAPAQARERRAAHRQHGPARRRGILGAGGPVAMPENAPRDRGDGEGAEPGQEERDPGDGRQHERRQRRVHDVDRDGLRQLPKHHSDLFSVDQGGEIVVRHQGQVRRVSGRCRVASCVRRTSNPAMGYCSKRCSNAIRRNPEAFAGYPAVVSMIETGP